jgi:sugar phosphate isomerase/epimerase
MSELSMNETTTYRWSFEEDVAEYAAAGIPAIGVWRQKLSDCGLAKALELLQQTGLRVSHLFWAGGFTGGDGRSYRESIEDAREALGTASALGTKILAVCSGPRAGHTHKHARRLIENALVELLPQAEDLGVTLAIEPMHAGCSAEWTFLTTVDDVLDLLNSIGSRQVKMVLDTYHVGQSPGLAERAAEIAPHVAIVHLGDGRHPPDGEQSRCRLGDGIVPLRDIVAALETAGYNGYYDVELHGEEIEIADYHSLLEHAKQAFATLLARK